MIMDLLRPVYMDVGYLGGGGGGVGQVCEVIRLDGVTRLSIQSLILI